MRKGKGKGKGRERERDREGGRKRDSVEKQGRQREKTDRQPERPSLRENFVICSKLTCQTIGVSPGIISNRDSVESSSLSPRHPSLVLPGSSVMVFIPCDIY